MAVPLSAKLDIKPNSRAFRSQVQNNLLKFDKS